MGYFLLVLNILFSGHCAGVIIRIPINSYDHVYNYILTDGISDQTLWGL